MAEREDQPPPLPVGLSAEEADRLSERFRPSWEASGESGQAPLAPTTPAEPRKAVKQTLVGGISPVPRQPPLTAAEAVDAKRTGHSRPPQQTLVGIQPVSTPPPLSKAPTSSPVTAGGSPDGPTGIAKIYIPKDDPSGPAVMLTEEVQQAEAAANAEIEARRRGESSRHMQTVVNIKAPDLPGPEPLRPKRKSGFLQLLLGVGAGVLVVAAVFKLTTKESEPTPASANPAPAATVEQPAPTASEPASSSDGPVVTPVAPSESPRPVVLPAETARTDALDRATGAGETVSRRAPSKPAAPATKKAAPKPSKPSTASSPPASKGGVIVRDSPF